VARSDLEATMDGGVDPPRRRWFGRQPDEYRFRGDDDDEDRDRGPSLSGFRRAASLQRVRTAQSRAALTEGAGLSDEEVQRAEAIFSQMNDALTGYGEELLFLAAGDEPAPARDLLGVTHDVTGILHRAQTELEALLGEDRLAGVDPDASAIWNYVDLERLEPAARVALERRP
jgi:hypothetical protein